jgi:hypothetical protein
VIAAVEFTHTQGRELNQSWISRLEKRAKSSTLRVTSTNRALGVSIFSEADDLEVLQKELRDAVLCHF